MDPLVNSPTVFAAQPGSEQQAQQTVEADPQEPRVVDNTFLARGEWL